MSKVDDLIDERDALILEVNRIKTQIQDAKARAASNGDYSDNSWFVKVSHALRSKQAQLQRLQTEIGRAGREERRSFNNRIEKKFIEVAREMLDEETFSDIMNEAKFRNEEEQK